MDRRAVLRATSWTAGSTGTCRPHGRTQLLHVGERSIVGYSPGCLRRATSPTGTRAAAGPRAARGPTERRYHPILGGFGIAGAPGRGASASRSRRSAMRALQQRDLVVQRELEDLRCEVELGEVPPLDHGVPLRVSPGRSAHPRGRRSCSNRLRRSPIALMRTDTSPSVTVTVSSVGRLRAGPRLEGGPAMRSGRSRPRRGLDLRSSTPPRMSSRRPRRVARMLRRSAAGGNPAASATASWSVRLSRCHTSFG